MPIDPDARTPCPICGEDWKDDPCSPAHRYIAELEEHAANLTLQNECYRAVVDVVRKASVDVVEVIERLQQK